jgi:hypothetical protein
MFYAGEEVAGKLSLRVQQLDVSVETKTKVGMLLLWRGGSEG